MLLLILRISAKTFLSSLQHLHTLTDCVLIIIRDLKEKEEHAAKSKDTFIEK